MNTNDIERLRELMAKREKARRTYDLACKTNPYDASRYHGNCDDADNELRDAAVNALPALLEAAEKLERIRAACEKGTPGGMATCILAIIEGATE